MLRAPCLCWPSPRRRTPGRRRSGLQLSPTRTAAIRQAPRHCSGVISGARPAATMEQGSSTPLALRKDRTRVCVRGRGVGGKPFAPWTLMPIEGVARVAAAGRPGALRLLAVAVARYSAGVWWGAHIGLRASEPNAAESRVALQSVRVFYFSRADPLSGERCPSGEVIDGAFSSRFQPEPTRHEVSHRPVPGSGGAPGGPLSGTRYDATRSERCSGTLALWLWPAGVVYRRRQMGLLAEPAESERWWGGNGVWSSRWRAPTRR